uniref:hypothetical protein n=1 Tax=uncultured Gimesia sp. TaxID=1678688 RepID=UPI0026092FBE
MPSIISLQDAKSQCGEEIIETIKDAISPFNEHHFAQQIYAELEEKSAHRTTLRYRLAPSIVCRSEI